MILSSSYNKREISLERNFISLVLNKKCTANIFNSMKVGSLNFAGKLVPVGEDCRWKFTNNVQCSGNEQMN
jgi:hypothetical protein